MRQKLFTLMALAVSAGVAGMAGVLSVPALAADSYTIDAGHSEVSFQIRHLVSQVRGRFNDFSGTIALDAAKPESSSVEFKIKATSVDTALADRDKHLRSADFFDVEKHPEITFKSTAIKASGKDTYAVTGNLTIRGVTKQVTLPVSFLGTARDPWGNDKAGFETATTLNRKDYGIVWNAALDAGGFILGDDVKVSINLEAQKAKAN
jgi:polyisoprenoid-binding protein YceI